MASLSPVKRDGRVTEVGHQSAERSRGGAGEEATLGGPILLLFSIEGVKHGGRSVTNVTAL
jgi:hypothetical protein